MITVAIGLVVIAGIILTLFAVYDTERSKITEAEETSREQENDRLKEDIDVFQSGGEVTIDNKWAEETVITGVVVVCDDNVTRHTASCVQDGNGTVSCGGDSLADAIGALEGLC